MILGLTVTTKPEEIYRAIIESTAFGAKVIIETFESQNIKVNEIFAAGGIAKKDEMMMQIYADVMNKPIHIASTAQAGALGSAINATVAAGIYKDIKEAASFMKKSFSKTYYPKPENVEIYKKLFDEYKLLHDYFGKGGNDIMKRLQNLK
jgi:L-ribulokinase